MNPLSILYTFGDAASDREIGVTFFLLCIALLSACWIALKLKARCNWATGHRLRVRK